MTLEYYMIEFQRKHSELFSEDKMVKEQQRFQDLMHENLLHSVQVSADLERVWMILKVKDKETAKEVISTLPYCSHFPHEIHQLIWNEY